MRPTRRPFRCPCVSALLAVAAALGILIALPGRAADWPTWRFDAGRTGASPERLPEDLHLQWVRQEPPLRPAFWQVRQERVQFDLGYEPVVLGKTMFLGSSRNDRITALDTETGRERWRFYTEGPIRLAPTAWEGKVYGASDDGVLYCLDAETGALLWKHRAAPSRRRVVGNGRLISVWPVRGGPVVAGGRVFFAAGVWPFEGIFVWAIDAETGTPAWVNDRCGSLYLEHPHAAMAFGGPSPQGYLLVRGNELVVPGSRAFPAFFDLETGKLLHFDFGYAGHGSRPGSWFVASDPKGELLVDPELNAEIHDVGLQVIGQPGFRPQPDDVRAETIAIGRTTYRIAAGVRSSVNVGGRELRFGDGFPGVEGEVHTMLAADGKLFVVTRDGSIHCFGSKRAEPAVQRPATRPLDPPDDGWAAKVRRILEESGAEAGYAVVLGLGTGRAIEELSRQSELHVMVFEPDAEKANRFRRRWDDAGLYGEQIAVYTEGPADLALPRYTASLVVSEERHAAWEEGGALRATLLAALRPYGGALYLGVSADEPDRQPDHVRGPLPGAANYRGGPNDDQRVRAPLGLLWFGDTFHRHKLFHRGFRHETGRGLPQGIEVIDGLMRYEVTDEPYGPNPRGMGYHDYLRLLDEQMVYHDGYTDVYTGRVLSEGEARRAAGAFDREGDATPENPPADDAPPDVPLRRNPLTGLPEARAVVKTYGCDRYSVHYGSVATYRSGTAAYYDNRLESGTISISGVRSGCRNSAVPAGGVLTLPSWTGNCTCNYPVHTSLTLAPMPPEFEQWSAWGDAAAEAPVRRAGINLGAPGNRADEAGTLWLEYPKVGGPSPHIPVQVEPAEAEWFYRHALWMEGGPGRPWVTASGVQGVRSLRIEPVVLKTGEPGGAFSVCWLGSVRPEHSETYTFHARTDHGVRLWVAGQLLLDNSQNLRRGEMGEVSADVAFQAGTEVPIRMEYYQAADRPAAGAAMAELSWSSPSLPQQVVPGDRLGTAEGHPGGLTGAYYATADLTGPAAVRTDARVRFDWGRELPEVLHRLPRPLQLPERSFTVALYFAEPEAIGPGERIFSVRMQGAEVLADFDIVREAGGPNRSAVRTFAGIRAAGALEIEFIAKTEKPALVCGVELIEE